LVIIKDYDVSYLQWSVPGKYSSESCPSHKVQYSPKLTRDNEIIISWLDRKYGERATSEMMATPNPQNTPFPKRNT
jgi:hypothetical protein